MRKANRIPWLTIIGAALVVLTASLARAEIILDTAFPVENEPVRIHVIGSDGGPVPNAALTATYRPGSAVPAEFDVGKTGEDGNRDWTPREAGIVTIRASWVDADGVERSAAINTSVKYSPTPIGGIMIMIIAGIVLIGGAVERIARLLSSPEAE